MKKYALVLSGGGFKGAFQIGALRHLKKHWSIVNPGSPEMKFDIVAGVSVGSLNGVLTASNQFDELEKLWLDIGANVENIYTSDFIDTKNQSDQLKVTLNLKRIKERFIPGFKLRLPFWKLFGSKEKLFNKILEMIENEFSANFKKFKSIADNTPLKNRLKELVSRDRIKDCIYRCGFVSLNDGKYYSYRHTDFTTDDDFRNGILASTAMPIVWEPVGRIFVDDRGQPKTISQSVDGGIRNVSPLGEVIDEINADVPDADYTIVIINCNSGAVEEEKYEEKNIAGIALRSLNDIAITEIFNNDITEFLRINDIIDQVRSVHPGFEIRNYKIFQGRTAEILRPFKTIIIQTNPNVLGDPLVANGALNAHRIAHGEQKAAEALRLLAFEGNSIVVV